MSMNIHKNLAIRPQNLLNVVPFPVGNAFLRKQITTMWVAIRMIPLGTSSMGQFHLGIRQGLVEKLAKGTHSLLYKTGASVSATTTTAPHWTSTQDYPTYHAPKPMTSSYQISSSEEFGPTPCSPMTSGGVVSYLPHPLGQDSIHPMILFTIRCQMLHSSN